MSFEISHHSVKFLNKADRIFILILSVLVELPKKSLFLQGIIHAITSTNLFQGEEQINHNTTRWVN